MHDFLQSPSHTHSRTPFAARPALPDWVQRGIMRSFGEDEVTAPYRSSPRAPGRPGRKGKNPQRK